MNDEVSKQWLATRLTKLQQTLGNLNRVINTLIYLWAKLPLTNEKEELHLVHNSIIETTQEFNTLFFEYLNLHKNPEQEEKEKAKDVK